MARLQRSTADLSGYPDLVVTYLGMRVEKLRGLATLFSFGPKIKVMPSRTDCCCTRTSLPCMPACANTGGTFNR